MSAAIRAEDVSYVYSPGTPFEKTAVSHVNLEIEAGEFVGIIGHTGSGKSTFIQHLNGLLAPTSGKVYIDGKDIWENKADLRQVRFNVGLVFQYPEYQLFEETVYKDIAFGPKNMGLSEEEIDKSVREAAGFVGIPEEMLEKSPFELSGGQKRRVAIAGVIAMNPKVLILDEPAAGLDPKGRRQILGQIHAYHKQVGNTVLLISHSMEDVAAYAKKILVMNKGGVFDYDTVANIFERADELQKMGLAVPQITRVFRKLKAMGYPVRTDVYTTAFAEEEIIRLIGKPHANDEPRE